MVSKWGHDFRPAYMDVDSFRRQLGSPPVPIQALTATATAAVRADIAKALGLREPVLVTGSCDRPNLFLECVHGHAFPDDEAEE